MSFVHLNLLFYRKSITGEEALLCHKGTLHIIQYNITLKQFKGCISIDYLLASMQLYLLALDIINWKDSDIPPSIQNGCNIVVRWAMAVYGPSMTESEIMVI